MKITRAQLRSLIQEAIGNISEAPVLKPRVTMIEPKQANGMMDLMSAYGEIKKATEPVEFTVKNGKVVEGPDGDLKAEVQRVTTLVLGPDGAPYYRGRKKTGDAQRKIVKTGTFKISWGKK